MSVDRNLGNGKTRREKMRLTPTGTEAVDPSKNALVITGQALIHALADYPDLFLRLGELCSSVRRAGRRLGGRRGATPLTGVGERVWGGGGGAR